MILSQKERFLSSDLFDCPVCLKPIIKINSYLKNHIGCVEGHYDMYHVPNSGKIKKELVTSIDGFFSMAFFIPFNNGNIISYTNVYTSNYEGILSSDDWGSDSFVNERYFNIDYSNLKNWIENFKLME